MVLTMDCTISYKTAPTVLDGTESIFADLKTAKPRPSQSNRDIGTR
jgi:hypothetical protein